MSDLFSPIPARVFQLPFDDEASLTAFYGRPSETNLAYFKCPPEFYIGSRLLVRHRCHHHLVERLESALQSIYDRIGSERWKHEGWGDWAGCWNHRPTKGNSVRLSTHAWGIATDHAPSRNPFRIAQKSLSDEGIDIMERHGFLSGWRAWRHDAMHFQAAMFRHLVPGSYYAQNGYPTWIV